MKPVRKSQRLETSNQHKNSEICVMNINKTPSTDKQMQQKKKSKLAYAPDVAFEQKTKMRLNSKTPSTSGSKSLEKNNTKRKRNSTSDKLMEETNKSKLFHGPDKQTKQTKKSKLAYAPDVEFEQNTRMHFNANNPFRTRPTMKEKIITPIKDISPMIADMTIKGRCISVWHAHKPNEIHDPYGLECILQDEESNRIQIFVKRDIMFKFEPHLREGQCYMISNFGVVENSGRMPMLPNRWKISFYKETKSTRIEEIDENFYGFVNEPFSRILDTRNQYNHNDTVDVYGTVVSIGNIEQVDAHDCSKLRRTVIIEDTRSLRLECTFWNQYALKWNKYADDLNETANLSFILILGKIKYWNGKPSIHNAQFGTRIFIYRDTTPLRYFLKSYEENNGYDGSKIKNGNHNNESQIVTQTELDSKKQQEIAYIDLSDYQTEDEDENLNKSKKLVQVKLEKNS